MKIGIYFPALDPQTGGAFTLQDEILGSLARRANQDHSFVVFSWKIPETAADLGLPVELIPGGFWGKAHHRLAGMLGRPSWVNAYLRERGVDCVFYPAPSILTYDIPYGLMHWDLQHRNNPYFPEVSLRGEWEKREQFYQRALRRAAFILTGTETGKREISGYFQVPPDRIFVAPMPMPSYVTSAGVAAEISDRVKGLGEFFFYPAQFWAHKNHANLLLALAQLKGRGHKPRLVFSGSDKGNLAYVRELAQRVGVADQVDFLGFVSREELVALYTRARALTFVSLCGPDNLPPLEAFALGCPVLASDVPGAQDQMGEAALLVDALDPLAIAEGMQRILTDGPLRDRLVAEGRNVAKAASGDNFVQCLLSVLNRFARTRRTWGS